MNLLSEAPRFALEPAQAEAIVAGMEAIAAAAAGVLAPTGGRE